MRNRIVGTLSIVIIVTNLRARVSVRDLGLGKRRKLIINSTVLVSVYHFILSAVERYASKIICYLFICFLFFFFRARLV